MKNDYQKKEFPQKKSSALGNLENFKHIKRMNYERNE